MNIFDFRDRLIDSYQSFSRSFTKIHAEDIRNAVNEECIGKKRYWPEPLLQINPCYRMERNVDDLVAAGRLDPLCGKIFRDRDGKVLSLFKHQEQAIDLASKGESYVVTTGTGSGKSLSFFIPIVDRIIREKKLDPRPRTRAIILYPMNALANSQLEEIDKYLKNAGDENPITVRRYTGQDDERERQALRANPPDVLLTNYMMLELVLMRYSDREIVSKCRGLEFLVLDELHTYRGRQGADVAMLVRRLRTQLETEHLVCIGTSATMASGKSRDEQNQAVARFAERIFGTPIKSAQIINETLQRVTEGSSHAGALAHAVRAAAAGNPGIPDYAAFRKNPLSGWIEKTLSVTDELQRAQPLSVSEVTERLAKETGVSQSEAVAALKNFLSCFGGENSIHTPEGRNPFPFRLHQFLSGPGKVYVTLEAPGKRSVTLDGQAYESRGDARVPLFETHFCRECGEEYIPVWAEADGKNGIVSVSPRSIDDIALDGRLYGYLTPVRFGQRFQGAVEELPDEWRDDSKDRPAVKRSYRDYLPQRVTLDVSGKASSSGTDFWFLPGKFRLCVNCLTTYLTHGRDRNRLIGLSGEGRSSATSVLTLQILRQLYEEIPPELSQDFRKVLGFADNRQDAALQAGHFNDFINQLILRSGLVGVIRSAGTPLSLTQCTERIMQLFGFDDEENEAAQFEFTRNGQPLHGFGFQKAQELLRFTMSYRLLMDLRDENFYTCPSLEKLSLLHIDYFGLNEIAQDEKAVGRHGMLRILPPEARKAFFRAFLEAVRFRRCIASRYFDAGEQRFMRDMDKGLLSARWSLFAELGRELSSGSYFTFEEKLRKQKGFSGVMLSRRSQIVRRLVRLDVLKALPDEVRRRFSDADGMVDLLREAAAFLTEQGMLRRSELKSCAVYRIDDGVIRWALPDESGAVSMKSDPNAFFRRLYEQIADLLESRSSNFFEFEAEEHTAQVSADERKQFEMRFRATEKDRKEWQELGKGAFRRLPVLYCSPTMELGIDIYALNYVYMRNVPPTAANYVQRAGRAGRSGQQALALTYCASMSPHDQWFFQHPEEMVQGIMKEPALDLTNELLLRTHLHSLWMSAVGVDLARNVADVVESESKDDGYPLRAELQKSIRDPQAAALAVKLGRQLMDQIGESVKHEFWWKPNYVESVMESAADEFNHAFDAWRALYASTLHQIDQASQVLCHSSKGNEDLVAKRRLNDALNQKRLLTGSVSRSQNNDFYTYRYLANQGFLPGYNFPAMPMTAWIPSPIGAEDEFTMLSRARFLGISEFGPQNLIYHRGRIYRIRRLKLESAAAGDKASSGVQLPTIQAVVCPACGYAHELGSGHAYNECQNCGTPLAQEDRLDGLYRVSMVETEEAERITVEEENRRSQGFDMLTLYRFDQASQKHEAQVTSGKETLATLTYGPSATLWRVNLGWKGRKHQDTKGFVINPVTGYWAKQSPDAEADAKDIPQDPEQDASLQVIVPYVTDVRNILLMKPLAQMEKPEVTMATLQSAFKRAIERHFQIESSEIFVEPLPSRKDRRLLLIYESGEGGSGVLHHLMTDRCALAQVADLALRLMHYEKMDEHEPWKMEDLSQYDRKPKCIAGCYECLLNYYNQPEHSLIDRRDRDALKFLMALANDALVEDGRGIGSFDEAAEGKPESVPETAHGDAWERFRAMLLRRGCVLPDQMPKRFKGLDETFDGAYKALRTVISMRPLTEDALEFLEDVSWTPLDLSDESRWDDIIAAHPEIFLPRAKH